MASGTPKKKLKASATVADNHDPLNVLYAIGNISSVIRSPSKSGNKKIITWFEFSAQSENDLKKRRVCCFDKKVHDYLVSDALKDALNDPTKGVYIRDLQSDPRNPGQYKWSDNTTIGNVNVDLPKPFDCSEAANLSICAILFQMLPKTFVSLVANVSGYHTNQSATSACTVHKYSLIDDTNDITLTSFKKLDIDARNVTYRFSNEEV